MSQMLGVSPQRITLAAAEVSSALAIGTFEHVGLQITSGTGPLEIYTAQDDSGPFDVADFTVTAAQQKESFAPAANVMKLKNAGPDALVVKVQGYGVKRFN